MTLPKTRSDYERENCTIAAEVRRLREENERLAGCVNRLKVERAWAIREAKRLTEENERLRADSARIDWLADVNNTVGSVVLPRHIVEQNISSLRQAIDAARSEK